MRQYDCDFRPIKLAAVLVLCAGAMALPAPAAADPYRWCAVYASTDGDAGTNCYFVTLDQCRAAVSGVGGFCTPNNFFDGRPVATPGEPAPHRRARP